MDNYLYIDIVTVIHNYIFHDQMLKTDGFWGKIIVR